MTATSVTNELTKDQFRDLVEALGGDGDFLRAVIEDHLWNLSDEELVELYRKYFN